MRPYITDEKNAHSNWIAKNIIESLTKTGGSTHSGSYEKSEAYFSCREQGDDVYLKLQKLGVPVTLVNSFKQRHGYCYHAVTVNKTKIK